ncbi:NAD(P)/FAD-dependent oxidoreductase [Leeuwenhoekiella sp. MAR_2009_132]|uniref:NAD(P)/FAD-dependent oxidoreductase n=1 Tax=Leeuwenhoekiella sp. MAR_2009_132 TaxID=1392489 RepID=UPI00055EAD4A|nr:FAD-dependent oxidoreductase [Leeuwenhoekiella sp. MAR_2009_132]
MKYVDYLIVGFGLAGMAFCDQLEQHNKSFFVIDTKDSAASRVAAGLINPVTLKRYTMPYKGEEQFDLAKAYFTRLNEKFGFPFMKELPVLKIFSSIEDQNNWFEATDKPVLNRFLNASLVKNNSLFIEAPLQLGEVKETSRIDIPALLDAYAHSLMSSDSLSFDQFNYDELVLKSDDSICYRDIKARRVVFAEGYGIKQNPFFNKLPLVGNKGEYLIIKAPDLRLSKALKASFFIIPLGDDLYKVGATFNWKDKDSVPTTEALEELLQKLNKVITCEYTLEAQQAGIRPTTGDRRPLIGVHPNYKQLVLLNGLGTRGTMMSPYLAKVLFEHLELGIPLDEEISISRFPKKF